MKRCRWFVALKLCPVLIILSFLSLFFSTNHVLPRKVHREVAQFGNSNETAAPATVASPRPPTTTTTTFSTISVTSKESSKAHSMTILSRGTHSVISSKSSNFQDTKKNIVSATQSNPKKHVYFKILEPIDWHPPSSIDPRYVVPDVQKNISSETKSIYFSVRTTVYNHNTRLPAVILTWMQTVLPSQVYCYLVTAVHQLVGFLF